MQSKTSECHADNKQKQTDKNEYIFPCHPILQEPRKGNYHIDKSCNN